MYQLLIVDDERLVVDSLTETIAWDELGIEHVYRAYSSKHALQLLNTNIIDIVITDIRMPEISGLELIETIRETNPKVKCIVHSGYADFDYAKQAMSSQVTEYLIKPASDEDLTQAVTRMAALLDTEWTQLLTQKKINTTLKEQSPLIRATLLNDVIKGKRMGKEELETKLALLEVPLHVDDSIALAVLRLEEGFSKFDSASISLFEYAILNIAEETFGIHFDLVTGKDPYDYLVLLVKMKTSKTEKMQGLTDYEVQCMHLLQQTVLKLQENVRTFLKGKISVVVSTFGTFPSDVAALYQACVATIRRSVGNDQDMFLTLESRNQVEISIKSMQSLYETPTLMQMLDMGNRDMTMTKLEAIISELEENWSDSQEQLTEVFFQLGAAFAYAVHKNGKLLEELLGPAYEPFVTHKPFLSVNQLKEWVFKVADLFYEDINQTMVSAKNSSIQQIQRYINAHLAEDVTLQTIAEHIHMHPVYLSKIFKTETGENISEFIIRLKMQKAAYLLKQTDDRIYQICTKIGYQNPPYFIKLFKKFFGMTPQEYRDASAT
ncbi:response regulator transcription factor [Paenibacillus qinlingensis]|uniref:response regulator transcription factor n=1 Tax=Paenibacillus qinlingensis TaxID=1837343 RepID=UPI001566B925|nr:response regulator [Paenibacillus qinlingensis]NQX60735.1 response regulator [Paenibacillus qinlingensis]